MPDKIEEIEELLDKVREMFGPHSVEPYGNGDDPTHVGFKIRGIPATFSVIAGSRLPNWHFNVQFESYPPDLDYLYHNGAMSLWDLMELLKLMSGPRSRWPGMPGS